MSRTIRARDLTKHHIDAVLAFDARVGQRGPTMPGTDPAVMGVPVRVTGILREIHFDASDFVGLLFTWDESMGEKVEFQVLEDLELTVLPGGTVV